MDANIEKPAYVGNWADSLGSIVDKTEQNLYGTGQKPKLQDPTYASDAHNCVDSEVYPLNLGNFLSAAPRPNQVRVIEERERDYLEEQFKRDTIKNIETLDKKFYKETDY